MKPPTFDRDDVIGEDGDLRVDVFERALKGVNPDSSPGFPFYEYAKNRDVPAQLVYDAANALLKNWESNDGMMWLDDLEELNLNKRTEMFLLGLALPSTVFVKGEATKIEKIARLIYGVSLVMNVIGRILFGSYLASVTTTWDSATHKVGLDMYTSSGLKRLKAFFDVLKASKKTLEDLGGLPYFVVSDDIQGWEYMARLWMHFAWHKEYLHSASATPYHRALQRRFMVAEAHAFVVDSDGILHAPPTYYTASGKILTHKQNSDERAALAELDFGTEVFSIPTEATNGDDCLALAWHTDVERLESTRLGFVHTDIAVQNFDMLTFCSSDFFEVQSKLTRKPHGLAKLVFNVVTSNSLESVLGTLSQIENHPAYTAVVGLHVANESRISIFPW